MKQKSISVLLIVAMMLQLISPIAVFALEDTDALSAAVDGAVPAVTTPGAIQVEPVDTTTPGAIKVGPVTKEVKETLNSLKTYFEGENEWDYLTALSYRHGMDSEDLDFVAEHAKNYGTSGLYNAYKATISAVAAGKDPRAIETKDGNVDYISIIEQAQNSDTGSFNTNIQTHVECMQAAKMGQADVDFSKAVEFLSTKVEVDGDKAYATKWNGDVDIRPTALVLLGLSLFPEDENAKTLIPKCVKALKEIQNDEGSFEGITSGRDLALVIRALDNAGEDVTSPEYIKNGKSVMDALLAYQLEDKTFRSTLYSWDDEMDEDMMIQTFAALVEISQSTAMFDAYKAEVGTVPSRIEMTMKETDLLVGDSAKIAVKVYDNQGRVVPGVTLEWSSEKDAVATVADGLVKAIGEGSTKIRVACLDNPGVFNEISITVQNSIPTRLVVEGNGEAVEDEVSILSGETLKLDVEVYDQKGRLMTEPEISCVIKSGEVNLSADGLNITGLQVGKAQIAVQSGSVEKLIDVSVISMSGLIGQTLSKHVTSSVSDDLCYLEVLALKQYGMSDAEIQEKISLRSVSRPSDLAENIITLIAAGLDPRDYEGKDLVKQLSDSQKESGYFDIGYKAELVDIALPIIALEMAGGEYDKDKAYSLIHIKAKSYGSTRVCDSDTTRSKVENTALAIIALSFNTEDEDDHNLMLAMIDYLKEKETDYATFEAVKYYRTSENGRATAWAILALQAAEQEPLGSAWTKAGKTLYDGLLRFEATNGFKLQPTYSSKNKEVTQASLCALSGLYKGASAFHTLKMKLGEVPSQIEILTNTNAINEKESIQFSARVSDKEGLLVPGQKIKWSVSDETVGTFDEAGLLTLNNVEGDKTVVITAKVDGLGVSAQHTLNVLDREPVSIELSKPYGFTDELKEGESVTLDADIKDANGKTIDYLTLKWESSNSSVLSISEAGLLEASEVDVEQTIDITAVCDEDNNVKATLSVKIIPVVPTKIDVLKGTEIISEIEMESDKKISLKAKAYETDGSLIDDQAFTWMSSNPAVAEVDGFGQVTTHSVSEMTPVTITVKAVGFETSQIVSFTVTPKKSIEEKIDEALMSYKDYYSGKSELDDFQILIAAAAGEIAVIDDEKLSMTEVNYKSGYSGDEPNEYAKRIISLVAAGKDPYSDNGKNPVQFLVDSQNSDGIFETSSTYYSKDADDFAYSILALDMVGAEYDEEKAVKALMDKFTKDGEKAYIGYSYKAEPEYFRTGIPLMALAAHKDIEGVQEILDKGFNYLKSEFESKNLKADALAQMILTCIALDQDTSTIMKNDADGNASSMMAWLLKAEAQSAYIHGALLSQKLDKPLFDLVSMAVGDPAEIIAKFNSDSLKIKVGGEYSFSVIVTDADGKKIKDATFVVSSSDENVLSADPSTGQLKAVGAGTARLELVVTGNDGVKAEYEFTVIEPKAERVELNPVQEKDQLLVGERLKFSPEVFDFENEVIAVENAVWRIEPESAGHMIDGDTFVAQTAGVATISFVVTNSDKTTAEKRMDLTIESALSDSDKAEKAIEETFEFVKGKDSYDCMRSLALRSAGVEYSDIQEKVNIYGYDGVHNTSRNVMTIIGANLNPESYKEKNHQKALEELDFTAVGDKKYLPKALIALDMSGSEIDRSEIIEALIANLTTSGDQKYFEYEEEDYWGEWETIIDPEATLWTWIALSKYRDQAKVNEVITGIENYVKSLIDEDMLVDGSTDYTSLSIQGLIACAQTVEADGFTKMDASGNVMTLLDGLLSCKKGPHFSTGTDSSSAGYDTTEHAICALSDVATGSSMYQTVKYVEAGDPAKITVRPLSDSIVEGDEVVLEADVYDDKGISITGFDLKWSVNDPKLGIIEEGKLKTLSPGTVKVRVAIEGKPDVFTEIEVIISSGLTEEVLKAKAENELQFFKTLYVDGEKNYEFLAPAAANILGIDRELIQGNLYEYSRMNNITSVSKQIIGLVGAGMDPRDFKQLEKGTGREYSTNLVDLLVLHQIRDGEHKGKIALRSTDVDNAFYQSLAIVALDMADADYDKATAVQALVGMLDEDNRSDAGALKDDIEEVAWAMIALSGHSEKDGVQETISRLKDILASQQNDQAGFDIQSGQHKNSPIGTGIVVQALVAIGENPLTEKQWVKNRKTMLDNILLTKHEDTDIKKSGYYQYDGFEMVNYKATYHAFAAISDMYTGESMFKTLAMTYDGKVEDQTPSTIKVIGTYLGDDVITLYQGDEITLTAEVLNVGGTILEGHDIQWATDSDKISVSEDGVLKAENACEKVEVIARTTGNEDGESSIETKVYVNVISREIKTLEIDPSLDALRVGETAQITVKAFDAAGESCGTSAIRFELYNTDEKDTKVLEIDSETGAIAGIAPGTAEVVATFTNDETDTTVKSDPLEVTVHEKSTVNVTVSIYGDRPDSDEDVMYSEMNIEVDNFDLGAYGDGNSQIYSEPVVMNALIKYLEQNGVDCKDSNAFDAAPNLARLDGIGGLGFETGYPNSGWMYFINDAYSSNAINGHALKDGDRIRVFHVLGPDEFQYAKFKTDQNEAAPGGTIEFKLVALDKLPGTYKYVESPIADAQILVDGKALIIDGEAVKTDSEGIARFTLSEVKTYVISAQIEDKGGVKYIPPSRTIDIKEIDLSDGLSIQFEKEDELRAGYESELFVTTENNKEAADQLNYRFDLYDGVVLIRRIRVGELLEVGGKSTTKVCFALPESESLVLKVYLEDEFNNAQQIKSIDIK